MNTSSQQRLQELQSSFMELGEKLADTPEKEAISIIVTWRAIPLRRGRFAGGTKPG